MIDDTQQLTETFTAHEHLAPDAAEVLARSKGIATSMHRRRWAVRATGGAVLVGGLVAGGVGLPSWTRSGSQTVTTKGVEAADSPTPTPTPTTTYTENQEMDAFFNAGYQYSDAVQLGQLWNESLDQAKADAGLKLLEGDTLPIPPSGQPASAENVDVQAFFNAGYEYSDAVQLGQLWNEGSYQAKIDGGKKLLAGDQLPIPPSGSPSPSGSATVATRLVTGSSAARALARAKAKGLLLTHGKVPVVHRSATGSDSGGSSDDQATAAYFAAGYDYDDAVALGNLWNETDITQVKAEAGQKLLDGQTLPVKPSGTPESPDNKAVDEFFTAGYTYDDAVTLGQMWNESSYQAKIDGGQKLLDGQTLPIKP